MNVQMRKLGTSGLEVGPLALGGNVFGWTADEPTSFRLLDAFVAAGFNLIDTADMYSRWVPGHPGGESETVIGNWFKRSGKRGNVVLATKVGNEMGPGEKGLSKPYILRGGTIPGAPSDRLYRPLPVAHRRRDNSPRRDLGGLWRVDPTGQGEGDRRFKLHCGAARPGARGQQAV